MPTRPIPSPDLPPDAGDVDRIAPSPAIAPGEERVTLGQPFASYMQGGQATPMTMAGKSALISPFDLPQAGTRLPTATPTHETVLAQANQAQSTLGDIETYLKTPGLKLKNSQKTVLKTKLKDANMNFRAGNEKLGAAIPEEPRALSGPFGKFLSYLLDGQNQMEAAKSQLQGLKDKGQQLQPGDFLLIQLKLNKAQQELEYSSVMLANVVTAFKTLMQTQLG
jgi:hypothetical protein